MPILEVATGKVTIAHKPCLRGVDVLNVLNKVVASEPGREILLDDLNTHKPRRDLWLARDKSVHFHSIPTHAS